MKRAHIAFVSVPTAAHMNPTLPIVTTLLKRGHRVTYATGDVVSSRVESLGAEVVSYRSIKGQSDNKYCRLALNALATLAPFYEKNRPDLIIYDFVAFAGPILARRWGIPAIRTSAQFAFNRSALNQQIRHESFRELCLQLSAQADQLLEHYGVAGSDMIFDRERLNIFTFPREFEACANALDDTCLYAGRCAGEQAGFGDWRPQRHADGDKPTVLIAPSQSYVQGPNYLRTCIAAYAELPWRVILSVYENTELASLSPLPANVEVVQGVSCGKILPHVDLIVFMGGTTTAAEAAYHAVPLVITSLGFAELEWLGDNPVRLGIGKHIKGKDLSSAALRATSLEVLGSTAIQNNLRELQRSVRQQPGAEEIANRIEDYLDDEHRRR